MKSFTILVGIVLAVASSTLANEYDYPIELDYAPQPDIVKVVKPTTLVKTDVVEIEKPEIIKEILPPVASVGYGKRLLPVFKAAPVGFIAPGGYGLGGGVLEAGLGPLGGPLGGALAGAISGPLLGGLGGPLDGGLLDGHLGGAYGY